MQSCQSISQTAERTFVSIILMSKNSIPLDLIASGSEPISGLLRFGAGAASKFKSERRRGFCTVAGASGALTTFGTDSVMPVLAPALDMSAELRPGDASGIARKASIEKFRDLSLLTELDAKIRRLLLRKSGTRFRGLQ